MAAAGATILVARGLIWCGQNLEENYQNACKVWTNLAESARAENMRDVREMGNYLAEQIDYLAAGTGFAADDETRFIAAEQQRQQLDEAFARTRQILANTQQLAQQRTDARRSLLSQRLHAEILAAQDLVPIQEIASARAALEGTQEEMQQALVRLQNAWNSVSTAGSGHQRLTRQARQTLSTVDSLLTAIDALRQNVQGSSHLTSAAQRASIVALVREAEALLDLQPSIALGKARAAEQAARQFMETISGETVAAWNDQQRELNTLRGMLASLTLMLQEARAVQLLDADREERLSERVRHTDERLDALAKGGSLLTASQLARLRAGVEVLKQEVFALVRTTQQHNLARTIAETLADLGFRSGDGTPPALKQQGDAVHIQVVRQSEMLEQQDEKIVSFDIEQDGTVSYDFSGYIGNSCLSDARRVFAALREKGVFLLDEKASAELQSLPGEQVTMETLQDEHFSPQPVQNKTQAELAETLLKVLQKMGYPTIQQRTVGGSIELEAFKGQLGYRVVLSPDGETRILKDAQGTDVSGDAGDPLAAQARQIVQQAVEAEEEVSQKERHRRATFRQKRRQALG
jgi:adenosyl cobinamide kinase/adenosyl cobinamide phosphate guanylyltransferase